MAPPKDVTLKSPDQFRLLGRSQKRLDAPAKVTGEAKFGLDVSVPGMRTAVIARPPTFGARLKSFDDNEAKKIKGVYEVVRDPRWRCRGS